MNKLTVLHAHGSSSDSESAFTARQKPDDEDQGDDKKSFFHFVALREKLSSTPTPEHT
jgi:hypothetical protein